MRPYVEAIVSLAVFVFVLTVLIAMLVVLDQLLRG